MKILSFLNIILLLIISSCNNSLETNVSDEENKITLVIHGGAGTILRENMSPEMEKAYMDKLSEALQSGYAILESGGSALDAVENAVKILEDSPLFNAGKGAVFNADGIQEMDASIMDGSNLQAGAVAGVRNIKNPIVAARKVMENSNHVLLTGEGAQDFAKLQAVEMVTPEYFFDETRWNQFRKIKGDTQQTENKHGTVGAVARDKYGNLAAATSTGGMTNKKYGRIGDSPLIGAGTYANNNTCAVSATGHGEFFIRGVVCYDISALMEYKNMNLTEAANEVIQNKLTAIGGTGGIIGVDSKGNLVMTFNTPGMYRAYKSSDDKSEILIYKD
jgi:L-asparaginase / beta-aspartyl-peptidase